MISHEECKKLLNKNREDNYADEEVKAITELLSNWARLNVDLYYSLKETQENKKDGKAFNETEEP
jgi:exonuclease V gamma subunit